MEYREIVDTDIGGLFAVRMATRENSLSCEQLTSLGITEASVREMVNRTYRGWHCEENAQIVGFAMGNRENGEMWVIAVLPDYECRGIGAELLTRVEEWLWSEGWSEIWLTTDVDTTLRAYGFYRRQGWIDHEVRNRLRYMKKRNPNRAFQAIGDPGSPQPER